MTETNELEKFDNSKCLLDPLFIRLINKNSTKMLELLMLIYFIIIIICFMFYINFVNIYIAENYDILYHIMQ